MEPVESILVGRLLTGQTGEQLYQKIFYVPLQTEKGRVRVRVWREEGYPLAGEGSYLCLAACSLTWLRPTARWRDSLHIYYVVFLRHGADNALFRKGSHRDIHNSRDSLWGYLPDTPKQPMVRVIRTNRDGEKGLKYVCSYIPVDIY